MRRCAIVTGGSSGIGRGIVRSLAAEGYDVVFSCRERVSSARAVLSELEARFPGGRFAFFEADFVKSGAATSFFDVAAAFLGGLDLLVNNAGVTLFESVFDVTEEKMDYLLSLLLRNYVLMTREAVRYMASRGIRGNVVNISSVRSHCAHPGDALYGGVKAALDRITESFALDAAPYGIRINNVLPGAIKRFTPEEEKDADPAHVTKVAFLSERIPLERYGTPEDVANLVVFLASEKASYITGTNIKVDGGLSLPGLAETASDAAACGWGRVPPAPDRFRS